MTKNRKLQIRVTRLGETAIGAERERAQLKEQIFTERIEKAEDEISRKTQLVGAQSVALASLKKYIATGLLLGTVEKELVQEHLQQDLSKLLGQFVLTLYSIGRAAPRTLRDEFEAAVKAGMDEEADIPSNPELIPVFFAAKMFSVGKSLALGWYSSSSIFAGFGDEFPEYSGDESIKETAYRIVDSSINAEEFAELFASVRESVDYGPFSDYGSKSSE